MKKRVSGKNLCLNKETIAHLSFRQMDNARGGCTTETIETCDTCETLNDTRPKESDNTCFTQEALTTAG
jgi:hypothetical protein